MRAVAAMSSPIPTRLTKSRVHEFAETLAARLKFTKRDLIEPFVVQLGGRIEYKTAQLADDRLPESIVVQSSNNFTIYLPSVTSAVRDRFTIAHELGHLFLHYPLAYARYPGDAMVATRWVDESNEDLRRAEWEANWFAAGFLMPSADFRETYGRCLRDLSLVALEFKVSLKAAQVRAQSLGLI